MLKASLKRYGVLGVVVAVTLASIVLSAAISAAVHFAIGLPMLPSAWAVTLICPTLIAPTMSWWAFDLVLKVERAHELLSAQSTIDHLTGLFNRRYFMDRLSEEIDRTKRYGTPFAVAFIDVDNFKRINDEHGHLSGDEVLRQLTLNCARQVREVDTLARIGGEEFALLLPQTTEADAERLVERLRASVASTRAKVGESSLDITVSIGLASWSRDALDVDGILRRADEALYTAKRQGKNRLVTRTAAYAAGGVPGSVGVGVGEIGSSTITVTSVPLMSSSTRIVTRLKSPDEDCAPAPPVEPSVSIIASDSSASLSMSNPP
jgi:diguanylate cyclase (GGDEF)-like protein